MPRINLTVQHRTMVMISIINLHVHNSIYCTSLY
uniref:Uncharacterized protein n=1 Tax=Arundo donax TaxID=35708 RepID=A0A0A8YZS3_ARUDO